MKKKTPQQTKAKKEGFFSRILSKMDAKLEKKAKKKCCCSEDGCCK